MKYEAVIGLEVHVEINTASKVFCGCKNDFHAPPNTHVCPICLGMPGVLPVLNRGMVERPSMVGLALNCEISRWSKMDRKNYFYPDLAKNYQISASTTCRSARRLPRIRSGRRDEARRHHARHMEEDTARNVHTIGARESGVDFNRCGVSLLEIVTEPDIPFRGGGVRIPDSRSSRSWNTST
jgi:aspartyl-tRNA(Asn)/glutamyl-tRNA(Gln) amidotransferase subunit B